MTRSGEKLIEYNKIVEVTYWLGTKHHQTGAPPDAVTNESNDNREAARRGFADVSILGGVYLTGPTPVVSTLLWMVVATAFSFVFARLRLATGSVWPAIALHSAWNAIIQTAFDPASKGTGAELWIGESGILIALTMTLAAVVFSYGKWDPPKVTRRTT